MSPVSDETIEAAIHIIATSGIQADEIESRARALVEDDMTARRLIDWIVEAFGFAFVAHAAPKAILPDYFLAWNSARQAVTLKFTVEPIFASSLRIAQRMMRDGSNEEFETVALKSSIASSASNGLSAGSSLDGACFSGPFLLSIPAEVYPTLPGRYCSGSSAVECQQSQFDYPS